MIIKASKSLIMVNHFIGYFSAAVIFNYFSASKLSVDLIVYQIVIAVLSYLVYVLTVNFDIETTEDNQFIGGGNKQFKLMKRARFVSKETIDFDRSAERSFFDRLIGQYKIYNKTGFGFKFNRYCFFKKDFKLLEQKLHTILGITI